MADLRTRVTELVTGLGMLGHDGVAAALRERPPAMVSVSPEQWDELSRAYEGGALDTEFTHAFANGQAFLEASDGLRGRRPTVIEWKGAQSNPGDESLPVDIRVDHVFLISCKYLSRILHNAAPARVFDHSLKPAQTARPSDWFDEVAPAEHQALYEATVAVAGVENMPAKASELTRTERAALKARFPARWPVDVDEHYARLCVAVSEASAERWQRAVVTKAEQEATLWRLLRFGPAPYFVLGTARDSSLRLRIATPWDWRQHFTVHRFDVEAKPGGQPMVSWRAVVKDRHTAVLHEVHGHVEVRWSHGRFGGWPEAKIYLDTPHALVPGYFPLR